MSMRFKNFVPQYLIAFSFLLGAALLPHSSAHAFQQIQLTIQGELIISPLDPADPDPDTVFGLEQGDPFNFTLLFDPTIQTNGAFSRFIPIDSAEVQLGSFNLIAASDIPGFSLSAGPDENSFSLLGSFFEEPDPNGLFFLGPFTAIPRFFDFTIADNIANPNQFPTNLTTADITDFSSGPLILSEQFGDASDVLEINFTGLTVASVPEPSSAIVLAFATLILTRRRRSCFA